MRAKTVTMRRFGPSGSSKNTNIALEQIMDVTARVMSEIFFDFKYILCYPSIH
jgi:hypothetical protein